MLFDVTLLRSFQAVAQEASVTKRHDVESAIADLMNEIVRAALRRRTRNRHT
jgi:hypothetical protein